MKFSFDVLLFAHQATAIFFLLGGSFLVFLGAVIAVTGLGMLAGDINWMSR